MEISGSIKFIGVEEQPTAAYTKRELVITTEEQYPQHISIEFPQGKCNAEMDKLNIGDKVKVFINIGGREWVNPQGETKYFNSIKGWKMETLSTISNPAAASAPAQKYVHTATDATYEAYKQAGWTEKQLVDNGKGNFVVTAPAPASAPAQPLSPPAIQSPDDDLPF